MNRRWLELIGYSKGNLKLEGLFTCDLNYFETLVSERGRESVRRREKGKDFWTPLEMGIEEWLKPVTLQHFLLLSVLNQERPANYQRILFLSDFVTKLLCLLILLFLLPIFKIILGPHLSTALALIDFTVLSKIKNK